MGAGLEAVSVPIAPLTMNHISRNLFASLTGSAAAYDPQCETPDLTGKVALVTGGT